MPPLRDEVRVPGGSDLQSTNSPVSHKTPALAVDASSTEAVGPAARADVASLTHPSMPRRAPGTRHTSDWLIGQHLWLSSSQA